MPRELGNCPRSHGYKTAILEFGPRHSWLWWPPQGLLSCTAKENFPKTSRECALIIYKAQQPVSGTWVGGLLPIKKRADSGQVSRLDKMKSWAKTGAMQLRQWWRWKRMKQQNLERGEEEEWVYLWFSDFEKNQIPLSPVYFKLVPSTLWREYFGKSVISLIYVGVSVWNGW